MKLNLNTRLFPNYSTVISASEWKEKKEAEEAEKKRKEEEEELYKNLGRIKTFAIGTTPNFVIDLDKDMLRLEDIEQLTVTFGQFGKMVQREMLYFSDNYKLDYELTSEGEYVPRSAEIKIDNRNVFDDNIHFVPNGLHDSEENPLHSWRHIPQLIRNPKFTYNKIYNKLTLNLTQEDTLYHFAPTDWKYDSDTPYFQGNPSLVMIEVKIKVRGEVDSHLAGQVVIRPQEYYAVADTIENNLELGKRPVHVDNKATPIYAPHRYRIYYGDYFYDTEIDSEGYVIHDDLPQRVEELHRDGIPEFAWTKQVATAILCRDGLRVSSFPRYTEVFDSEGDSEGHLEEIPRYFCVMIPLSMKVKVKAVKSLFGGSPGVFDNVDIDSEGLVVPKPGFNLGESWYFRSTYLIDPDYSLPENPSGEYICWYICSKNNITGHEERFFGPGRNKNQRQEARYDFLIEFKEIK